MNPTERTENDPRTVSIRPPASGPGLGGGRPATPKLRDQDPASGTDGMREVKNLVLGVSLLLVALVTYWMGIYLPDHIATCTIVASLGAAGLIWVLHRLGVLRQPHGILIAAGAIALFAAAIPFVERGFRKLDRVARVQIAGDSAASPENHHGTRTALIPPAPPTRTEMPAPVAPPASKPPADDVVREFIAPAPDPAAGKVIRLKQNVQVVIGGRKTRLRGGDQFSLKKFSDGKVTFLAGDQEVSVDAGLVTFTGKSQESPAEMTKLATEEVKKRYPGVFEEGSEQNDIFVARTKELKIELPEFFKNPKWPLELAEQIAAQQGWIRADQAPEEKESAPPKETVPPAPPQQSPE